MDAAVGMIVYSALLSLGLLLAAPWWLWRMASSARYRAGLPERLGRIPTQLRAAIAGKRVVWVHAVSVGELLAAERLIRDLQSRLGPAWTIALSTTTSTGQTLARERFPTLPVFFLPLDFASTLRPWMQALQPRLVVPVESELWPRWLSECRRANVPVAVVNARLSDRSFHRARRLRSLWSRMAANVTLFLPQGEESAARLRLLGVDPTHIELAGNLKFDPPPVPPSPLVEAVRQSLAPRADLVVCGSTLDGEEALILNAWPAIQRLRPSARLLLAPRHPQRFEAVARLIVDRGLPLTRLSALPLDAPAIPTSSVLLLDSLGSLAAMYSLAAVALVGGSLVPRGGHNPLEPARFGVPVLVGPSVSNFREIVDSMLAARAIRIVPPNRLDEAITAMLFDGKSMGERGRHFFLSQAGATQRTLEALLRLLQSTVPEQH